MTTRTVRLDPASERILAEIREATGLSVSDILKRGLLAAHYELRVDAASHPFAIYSTIDLGRGGSSRARARDAKKAIVAVLRGGRRR